MQLAAFLCVICVICGRIFTWEYSINLQTRNPNVSRWSRRLRRQTTKQQNSLNLKLTVFLCDIMQPAAFLCVICVICGRINTQAYSIYIAQMKPKKSPADHADLRRQTTKPQNNKISLPQTTCLSLRDNAACCIPLRHLRYLRENIHPNLLNLYT